MHFWATTSHQDDPVLVNGGIVYSILRDTKLALADFDLAIELNQLWTIVLQ